MRANKFVALALCALMALTVSLSSVRAALFSDTFAGGVSGTMTRNTYLKSAGDSKVSNALASDDGVTLTVAGKLVVTGSIASSGGGAARDLTTPIVLTATSSDLRIAASTADAVTTYTLPAASAVPGKRFCFAADTITGSNREIDVEPPGTTDLIVGTTNAAGATGIATTAGAAHGIKNTHATAVRGNQTCIQSDGTGIWFMTSLSGTWAAY